MLCPSDILIDYIARDTPFTVAVCNLICESFIGEKTTALCEAKGPARRHDRLAGKAHILGHYLLVILSEDEIIYHLTVRSLKAIVVAAFCSELELCLVCIVQEDTIAVAAHKERNALVERIFDCTVARLVAIPHLIALASSVKLACLFTKSEEVFVTAK